MRKITLLILFVFSHPSLAIEFERPTLTIEEVMVHVDKFLLAEKRVSGSAYRLASFSFVYPDKRRSQPTWLIFYKRKDVYQRDFYLKVSNELKPRIEFVGGE